MSDKSGIEWTDSTWPIVQGCDPVSPGCAGCYAVPLLWRLAHNPNPTISAPLQGVVEHHKDKLRFTGKVALRADRLDWPLKWKKPRKIFVPSHGDIFHKDVPDAFLDKIFAVMALCPQHTFQLLTKRPERMRDYCAHHAFVWCPEMGRVKPLLTDEIIIDLQRGREGPLPNVWLGVSCERQEEADERIPLLLQTPAAVRFISAEPLLGAIDLIGTLAGYQDTAVPLGRQLIDWVIVGGESGPHARPMHPQWARDLRDQCAAAGVAYFFKQWGEWAPSTPDRAEGNPRSGWQANRAHPCAAKARELYPEAGAAFIERVGKKAAGRVLDGRTHDDMPGCIR